MYRYISKLEIQQVRKGKITNATLSTFDISEAEFLKIQDCLFC